MILKLIQDTTWHRKFGEKSIELKLSGHTFNQSGKRIMKQIYF